MKRVNLQAAVVTRNDHGCLPFAPSSVVLTLGRSGATVATRPRDPALRPVRDPRHNHYMASTTNTARTLRGRENVFDSVYVLTTADGGLQYWTGSETLIYSFQGHDRCRSSPEGIKS